MAANFTITIIKEEIESDEEKLLPCKFEESSYNEVANKPNIIQHLCFEEENYLDGKSIIKAEDIALDINIDKEEAKPPITAFLMLAGPSDAEENETFYVKSEVAKMIKNTHIQIKDRFKPFNCNLCDYRSARKDCLTKHVQSKHALLATKVECNVCEREFKTNYGLNQHMISHSKEKTFKCDHCEFSAKRNYSLKDHNLRYHGQQGYCFECNECGYKCYRKAILANHMKIHMPSKKLSKCSLCDYKYSLSYYYKKHLMAVHLKPLSCTFCDYKCSRNDVLRRHVLNFHTQIKTFECNQCGYKTLRKSSLVCHMKRHLAEKVMKTNVPLAPLQCPLCEYECSKNDQLKKHVTIVHSQDELIKCNKCNYVTYETKKYNMHLKAHRNYKNHNTRRYNATKTILKCQSCYFQTYQTKRLKKHVESVHMGGLKCNLCEYTCSDEKKLIEHTLIHTSKVFAQESDMPVKNDSEKKKVYSKEKPFKCNLCDYRCYREANLDVHRQNAHTEMNIS